jgi:hypothetical protein
MNTLMSQLFVLILKYLSGINEGPIRRPEKGGSEWEPIKIILQREISAYVPNHNQGFHTSLPRSRSHNGPTNPRNKPQTIPKWKHNSRSKGLSCPAKPLADSPRGYGGPSASCGGLSKKRSRTSSTTPSIMDRLCWPRGPSVPPRTVRHSSTDRPRTSCNKNPPTKWIERKTRKKSRRTRRTPSQPAPRGLSAPTRRTVRQVRTDTGTAGREQEREHPTTYPSMDLPNGLSS